MRLRRGARREPAAGARPRVVVKFPDDMPLPSRDGAEHDLERQERAPWSRLAVVFPGARLAPLVRSREPAELDALQRRARVLDPSYRAPRLAAYFAVEAPEGTSLEKLASFVRIWMTIEQTYVQGPASLPKAVPALPAQSRAQSRGQPGGEPEPEPAAAAAWPPGAAAVRDPHGPAPYGVDLHYARRFPGGDRRGVRRVAIRPVHGPIADAILVTLPSLEFGDVLLVDAQYDVPGRPGPLPVEIFDAEYQAIRLATALGVVVVEAAGQAGLDLGTVTLPDGRRPFHPGDPGFRDSGAIMVTTGTPDYPRERAPEANYGSRIDCHGYGEPGAPALVADVTATVQALASAARSYRFAPTQLRELLRAHGTPADGDTPRIGVLPDLRQIVGGAVLRLAPDLYLRDFIGDEGEPHTGPLGASPDILVRPLPVLDPQLAFGEGSGTENALLPAEVAPGRDHYVYVRVRNQGGAEARDAEVHLFWTPVATLLTPDLWRPLGAVHLPVVPSGDVLTVSEPIYWPATDVPGEPWCGFVGVLHAADDPAPDFAALRSWDRFHRLVRTDNNVAVLNHHHVSSEPHPAADPPGYIGLPCLVTGALDRARVMALELSSRLPTGARVVFEAPVELTIELGLRPEQVEVDTERDLARVPLAAQGRQHIGAARLPAGSKRPCRLLVRLPNPVKGHAYHVALRQLSEGTEVGRITWVLLSP